MRRRIIAKRHIPSWRHRKAKRGYAKARKSSWSIPDRGKRGKTKKSKQWSKNVSFDRIPGYTIDATQSERLVALRKNIKAEGGGHKGALSTARTLQSIININPNRKSDSIMKSDLRKIYPTWGRK